MPEPDAAHPNRCLPDCCFLEAGIVALALPTDFNRIGSTACASRQQLQAFDPSQTEDHGIRSLPQVYLSTGGFHSTIPAQPALKLSDVRAQPPTQDKGYDTDETEGDLPDMTAIIHHHEESDDLPNCG